MDLGKHAVGRQAMIGEDRVAAQRPVEQRAMLAGGVVVGQRAGAALGERMSEIAARHGATARPVVSGESYLTLPGPLSEIVAAAIEAETGVSPELSTSGGTSDARFLKDLCPVIEFGLLNATMHKLDEAVAIADLEQLARIYTRIARDALIVPGAPR